MSISVKLPDGSVKSFESQVTCLQVAESISSGLAKTRYAPKLTAF